MLKQISMKKIKLFLFLTGCFFIANSQEMPAGLNTGDIAPSFNTKDQNGKSVSLTEQLKKGAVVLVFYRGQWCPFCNKQLKKLEDSLSFISAKGASVLAITAERPENISKTIAKTKASFPILFDEGLKIMSSYKVSYAVDAQTIEKYKGYGIDFNEVNGSNGANLPVPALYIIGKDGKIVYRYFDVNYTKRASVAEILARL